MIDETARTEPTAESTSQKDGQKRNKEPETEEVSGNTSPTGDDRTSFTIDKGNDKGTSEYSVIDPLTHGCEENELYKTTQLGKVKFFCFCIIGHLLRRTFLLNPDREPNERT